MAEKNTVTEEDLGVYNALLSGSSLNSTTFGAAITAAQAANQKVLLLTTGTWTLTTSHTVPRGVALRVPAGTFVTSASPVTITLQGPLIADDPMWYGGQVTVTYTYPQSHHASCITSGGQPTVPGSGLTISAFATTGLVADGASCWPVFQAAAAVTITNNATVWLALHRHTSQTVTNWTRQGSTHYLFRAITAQPADPPGGVVFAKVTVSGGNITAIVPCAYRSPEDAKRKVHNVRNWGALGDASTNDTAAFTAVIAALPNGGAIEIPCGIYMVDPLTISQLRGICIYGSSAHTAGEESGSLSDDPIGRSVLRARGTQTHVLKFSGFRHQIHDVVLDGNFTTTNVFKFETSPTSDCLVNRCVIMKALVTTGNLVLYDGGVAQVDYCTIRESILNQDPGDPTPDECAACIRVTGGNTFLNRVELTLLNGAVNLVDINLGAIDVLHCNFGLSSNSKVRANNPNVMRISHCYTEAATNWLFQDFTSAAIDGAAPITIENNITNATMGLTITQRYQVLLIGNTIGDGNVTLTGAGTCPTLAINNRFATTSQGFTGAGLSTPGVNEYGTIYFDGGGAVIPVTNLRSTQRIDGVLQMAANLETGVQAGDIVLGADRALLFSNTGDTALGGALRCTVTSVTNTGTTTLTDFLGFLFIVTDQPFYALFFLHGNGNAVTEILDPSNDFSTSSGTASSANIYWDTDHYELENRLGSTQTFRLFFLGVNAS